MNDTVIAGAVDSALISEIFDLDHYRQQTGQIFDLADAVQDYVTRGESAGLAPHPLFMPSHVKPQLTAALGDMGARSLLAIYLAHPELPIDPHPLFQCDFYKAAVGLPLEKQTCLQHYLACVRSGRPASSPTVLFDSEYYRSGKPLPPEAEADLLRHYLIEGWSEGRWPHPLFDVNYWRGMAGRLGVSIGQQQNPLTVYATDRRTWRAPTHTLFDAAYFAGRLEAGGLSASDVRPPLADMLLRDERVSGTYLFDPEFYQLQATQRGVTIDEHPLLHYARASGRNGLEPHPLFSSSYYLQTYPDVAKGGLDPLQHFLRHGRYERRDPNALFALKFYGRSVRDGSERSTDLVLHYVENDSRELIDPHPLFEGRLYAANNPECLTSGEATLTHYIRTWASQGIYFPPWGTAITPRRKGANSSARIDLIVVSHELTRTGAPLILLALVKEMVTRKGINCLVLAARGGVLLEQFREWAPVVDLADAKAAGISNEVFIPSLLASLGELNRPKLALINTACVDLLGNSFVDAGIPVVTLVHELATAFDYRTFKNIYDCSCGVVYPAEFVRNDAHIAYDLPIAKAEVIPQGLLDPEFGRMDAEAARRNLLDEIDAPDDAFIVMACGTRDLRKGIDVFAKVTTAAIALQRNSNGGRPLYFIWIGDGPGNRHSAFWYVQQDLARGGLTGRVHFLGGRMRTEPYFVACDAFILTSRQDPFPCVVHEAMACGKPIVAFEKSGGAPEALRDGAGLTVPYGDVAAMASVLAELAADKKRADAIGKRARQVVNKTYAFSDYADKILNCIERRAGVVLANPETAPPKRVLRATKPGRVIFTLPSWSNTAAERAMCLVIRGLIARGLDAELILTDLQPSTDAMASLPDVPCRLLVSTYRRRVRYRDVWERLATILDAAAPAILAYGSDDIAAALTPIVPARVGVLGLLHADDPRHLEQAGRLGRHWQRAVATSSTLRERVIGLVPALSEKCVVIPQGLPGYEPPRARNGDEPLRIVAALSSTPGRSAVEPITELVDSIGRSVPGVTITVLGGGSVRETLAGLFAQQITGGTVSLAGEPGQDVTGAILKAAHVFMLPTLAGNSPVGIADAMNAGLTVIRSAGKVSEGTWTVDGNTGFIVPQGDTVAWADKIRKLASDNALLARMRQEAQAFAREHSVSVPVMQNLYGELVDVMLAELRNGSYITPGPVLTHPQLGGLSLSPTFQTDPDEPRPAVQPR